MLIKKQCSSRLRISALMLAVVLTACGPAAVPPEPTRTPMPTFTPTQAGQQPVDQIITVFAPREIRIERIMKRDCLSFEETTKRMSLQRSDKEFLDNSDYVIVNDNIHSLSLQVLSIHTELINFAYSIKK